MTDWFRSWHGAPTDTKWLAVARHSGMPVAFVVSVAWAMMDRASQAADRGSIAGYDADGLSCFLGCEAEDVESIVAAMRKTGLIVDDRFASWEKRQPKREDDSSQRVKEHRERQRNSEKRDVTHGNAGASDVTPDSDSDSEKKVKSYGGRNGNGVSAAPFVANLITSAIQKPERSMYCFTKQSDTRVPKGFKWWRANYPGTDPPLVRKGKTWGYNFPWEAFD